MGLVGTVLSGSSTGHRPTYHAERNKGSTGLCGTNRLCDGGRVMAKEVSVSEAKAQIRAGAEFSATSATGGAQKKQYWTPDGRILFLVPQIRQYVRKDKDGNVIASGTRDANMDKGVFFFPPSSSEWE